MREAVIVSSVRTPVGRAFKGTLRTTRPDELAAIAIKGALERVPQDLLEVVPVDRVMRDLLVAAVREHRRGRQEVAVIGFG